jgi:hypothetical protein
MRQHSRRPRGPQCGAAAYPADDPLTDTGRDHALLSLVKSVQSLPSPMARPGCRRPAARTRTDPRTRDAEGDQQDSARTATVWRLVDCAQRMSCRNLSFLWNEDLAEDTSSRDLQVKVEHIVGPDAD